jgi:hypothetical protein
MSTHENEQGRIGYLANINEFQVILTYLIMIHGSCFEYRLTMHAEGRYDCVSTYNVLKVPKCIGCWTKTSGSKDLISEACDEVLS